MKEILESNKKIIGVGIAICFIFVVFMCVPTTVEVSTQEMEEYEEEYILQEKYIEKVPYIEKYQEPIYKTVKHEDAIYKTLSTYQIDNTLVKNVYDYNKIYTGTSFWGHNEYKVTMYYYEGLLKTSKVFYEVHSHGIIQKDIYEAIIGYNIWSEKVIDMYVTKERTIHKEETKYKDVVKIKTKEREIIVTETVDCLMYEKIFGMV